MNSTKENEISLTIQSAQGDWTSAVFDKTTKVEQVIAKAVDHFGFPKGSKYDLSLNNKIMKPQRNLVSYDVKDGDVLVLTELGVAV